MHFLKSTRHPRHARLAPRWAAVLFGAALLVAAALPAFAGDEPPPAPVPSHPLAFRDSVGLALSNSPYFVPTGMEIKVARMDVWDKRMDLLPDFFINTTYRVNNPDDRNSQPFQMQFSFGQYDPLQAYFSIGAYKLLVQRAVLEHLEVIDKGLHSLAQIYLGLDVWNRASLIHDEIIETARQQKAFATQRYNSGYGSTLDVMQADRHLEQVVNQKRKNEASHIRAQERLKAFLGVQPAHVLHLNLDQAVKQVLGDFNPQTVTFESMRRNSPKLRIKEVEAQLQRYQLRMAYAKYMPKYSFGVGREYSTQDNKDVYIATVGLTIPVWDWGERWRGIAREKERSQQVAAERRIKTMDLNQEFDEAKAKCLDLSEDMKLASSSAEIARVERQRAEIMYRSGSIEFPDFNKVVEKDLEMRLAVLSKEFEYDQAVLKLRHISGDLYTTYVDVADFEAE